MKHLVLAACLAWGAVSAMAAGEPAGTPVDPNLGAKAWTMCATCHGTHGEGKPALAVPPLAGQSAAYVESQLMAFRAGERGFHVQDIQGSRMRFLARSIPDDATVKSIASFVGALPTHAVALSTPPVGNVLIGKRLYQARCLSCHGDKAQGQEALGAPRLASLGSTYTLQQMKLFAAGQRSQGKSAGAQTMTSVAALYLQSPDDRRHLTAYLQTLLP